MNYPYHIQPFPESFNFFCVSVSFSAESRARPPESGIESFRMIRMNVGIFYILSCIGVFRLWSLIFFSLAPGFLFFATPLSLRLSILNSYLNAFLQRLTRTPLLSRFQEFITNFKQWHWFRSTLLVSVCNTVSI